MTRYLISFPSPAMDHIPAEDFQAVGEAAHAVVREVVDAGVWVCGTYPQTKELDGGFAVIDAPSREEAVEWAAKLAAACRCDQEVREFMPDPEVGN
jgi:hypothetical protein